MAGARSCLHLLTSTDFANLDTGPVDLIQMQQGLLTLPCDDTEFNELRVVAKSLRESDGDAGRKLGTALAEVSSPSYIPQHQSEHLQVMAPYIRSEQKGADSKADRLFGFRFRL